MGLSNAAIEAAWPRWWSQEAEASVSARADLRFSLARNLGLDPRTLFDRAEQPHFVWHEEARYKHLSGETDIERDAITSFGRALGALLVTASPASHPLGSRSAADLRQVVLGAGKPYVRLVDLLTLCWTAGIPVVHLRVFPLPQKRMAAMTVRVQGRFAILLGKDSTYPAQIAFYLAHELGHIQLEHLSSEPAVVDFDQETPSLGGDAEEESADHFALELLTGDPQLTVLPGPGGYNARALADVALRNADDLKVEPGILAMCFGYSTKDWPTTMAALGYIYEAGKPVWNEVNQLARSQLGAEDLPLDALDYLEMVLGAPDQ